MLTIWYFGTSSGHAQYTLASNLPPVLVGDAGPSPLTPMSPSDQVALGGSPSATGGDGNYTYSWSPTTGLDDPSIANPTITAQDDNVPFYVMEVMDGNGCTVTDTVFIDYPVSISNPNVLNVAIDIVPNPNDGSFTVMMSGKPSAKPMTMYVIDALGRNVMEENLQRFSGNFERKLDLSGLGQGVYFLGMRTDTQQVFKKLLIQ
ncbi:MAG: T9SS type A sorting domain-containing protein [Bacteroidota bacterium]